MDCPFGNSDAPGQGVVGKSEILADVLYRRSLVMSFQFILTIKLSIFIVKNRYTLVLNDVVQTPTSTNYQGTIVRG